MEQLADYFLLIGNYRQFFARLQVAAIMLPSPDYDKIKGNQEQL